MILVDLFCGAGGMSKGYHDAGFDIIGVDLNDQPNYPYTFVKADAIEWIKQWTPKALAAFGVVGVHASPPCQAYTSLRSRHPQVDYPELIEPTRAQLKRTKLPYVIENVVGAPLLDPVLLCGTMFDGLRVRRHRLFETNWPLEQPVHIKQSEHPRVMTMNKRSRHYGKFDQWVDFLGVYGAPEGWGRAAENDAMGINWMSHTELVQAIPPAYAEYIGNELMYHLSA